MEYTTTDGMRYVYGDQCVYCPMDTAGNHEINCPSYGYRIEFWREI